MDQNVIAEKEQILLDIAEKARRFVMADFMRQGAEGQSYIDLTQERLTAQRDLVVVLSDFAGVPLGDKDELEAYINLAAEKQARAKKWGA